jgi:hypothetical protein
VGHRSIEQGKMDRAASPSTRPPARRGPARGPLARLQLDAGRALRQAAEGLVSAFRATLTDTEARRIALSRALLVLVLGLAVASLVLLFILVVAYSSRIYSDLREIVGQFVKGPAEYVGAAALFLSPLLLSFDPLWLLLVLSVIAFGYASTPQRIAAIVAWVLLVPVFPVMDALSYRLALSSSPILRGAEALEEARYDQRVLDDLEGVKALLTEDVEVHFLLGRLYQALGQNDRAVAEYTEGARLSPVESRCPSTGQHPLRRRRLRFRSEDFQEALKRIPAAATRATTSPSCTPRRSARRRPPTRSEARALCDGSSRVHRECDAREGRLPGLWGRRGPGQDPRLEETPEPPHAGHYRTYSPFAGFLVPIVPALLLAIGAAFCSTTSASAASPTR